MRCLERNKQTIYFANLASATETVDAYGNYTGELTRTYGAPTAIKVNVSPARGTINLEMFGSLADYTKTIVTDDVNCPISASAALWVDKAPYVNEVLQSYNYVVTAIATGLNSRTYAIKEVAVG